jgi:hypothetical protein
MKATNKASEIETMLTNISGRSRVASVANNTCTWCGGPAVEFRNKISLREYRISGMCQDCQDKIFGTD